MEYEERLKAALADRYQIEGEIGSGGMATVYLAQDLKHDRKVAVKVLKPELAAVMGTERFLVEIRTTANLQHPAILPLHDSGEAGGLLYYVMPYVEGESLRQRLDREGQLPMDEAVRIAGRVADALDSAHRHGVIHRDLKPANILFQEGEPLVADFGIALAVSTAGEGRLTETGLSLGTPYYMSPEQAAGDQTPTASSDVYSLGCVLYEMLTGEPPHTGASAQAILGRILLAEVTRPTHLRRTIPANVEAAIMKALERLPADRFETAADFAGSLKDRAFRHGDEVAATSGSWNRLSIGLAVVAAFALALAGLFAVRPDPGSRPVTRQRIHPMGWGMVEQWARYFALAPDGSRMVYADTVGLESGWQLWVKDRDASEGSPLSGTEGARNVVFSPDGQWIAYVVGENLMRRPLNDAPAVPLLGDMEPLTTGLDWLSDGTILGEQRAQVLVRIPADGSAPPDTLFDFMPDSPIWVHGLPGEAAALVVTCPRGTCATRSSLNVLDLQTDTAWVLLEEVVKAWYLPTGHLLWVNRDGGVFATPFDLDQLSLSGNHQPLFEGVRVSQRQWKSADMVLGEDGTLVMVEGLGETYNYQPVWVDRDGREEVMNVGLTGDVMYPALSPDGTQLALVRRSEEGSDIWVVHLHREVTEKLTTGGGTRPAWTPDGGSVTYYPDRPGGNDIWVRRADGGGEATLLLDGDRDFAEVGWSPDGKWLILRTSRFENDPGDILAWEVGGEAAPIPIVATEFPDLQPSLSPDGRLLAYSSNRSGTRQEIYVRGFLDQNGGRWQVTDEGGQEPLWAESGGNLELFYRKRSTGDMVAVSVNAGDSTRFGQERVLFNAAAYRTNNLHQTYDVTPDGQRFLMLVRNDAGEAPPEPRMHMILNFFTELEERLGGG